MKKTVLIMAMGLFSIGLFAQEKEIEAAFTAIEANNPAQAKAELANIGDQSNSNTIPPDLMAKYFYTAGKVALSEGRSMDAAKMFSQLANAEKNKSYSIKSKDTKVTEYFATEAEATAAMAKGNFSKIKVIEPTPGLFAKVEPVLTAKAQKSLEDGTAANQAKNYKEAGNKYLETSYLLEALGGDPGLLKYSAALNFHQAKEFQKAFDIYKALIESGYTGEKTMWTAKSKDNGEEVQFATKEDADFQKNLGLVTDVKMVKTPSIEKTLNLYALQALSSMEKFDPIVDQISKKFEKDAEVQAMVGNVYHFSGNDQGFIDKLNEAIKLNPRDPQNFYNLGVLYKEKGDIASAKNNFEKAIQIKPDYKDAYLNLALTILTPEKEYVETINNNLGTSAKEKKLFKEASDKRKTLYIEALPYFEKIFELDKTDYQSAKMLRQAYQVAEMFDKEDAMRKIENSLKPSN